MHQRMTVSDPLPKYLGTTGHILTIEQRLPGQRSRGPIPSADGHFKLSDPAPHGGSNNSSSSGYSLPEVGKVYGGGNAAGES